MHSNKKKCIFCFPNRETQGPERTHHQITIETAKEARRAFKSKNKKTWDTLEWALRTEGTVKWLPSLVTVSFCSGFYISRDYDYQQ